jgi:hypothetical protein
VCHSQEGPLYTPSILPGEFGGSMGNLRWSVEGALACQQFRKGIIYEFCIYGI